MELTNQDIGYLCRSLALLLHAGVTPADGCFLLAREEQTQKKELLTHLGQRLDQGATLSDAMEESRAFGDYVTGMVRLGESAGRLEEALQSLADYYDEQNRIAQQLRQALAYPSLILLLMLAVIGVLLVKVLPVFDQVYASLGGRLTGVAAGLLHLGEMLEGLLPALLIVLALGVAAVLLYCCHGGFRKQITALYLRKFGDKGVAARFNNARFARGLAMGLSSGLPVEESMTLAAMLLKDIPGAAKRCGQCAEGLKQGEDLAEALGNARLLPASSCRLLTVGLRGGNGDEMMKEVADRLMEEAFRALETAVSRVEPAMVMAASVLVGAILLSVMLPLMNILSAIG